jgi:hypothetical protein
MTVMIVVGVMGLTWLAIEVSRPPRTASSGHGSEAVGLVHSEVMAIFIPPELEALAREPSDSSCLKSHEDVRRFLERYGLQRTWYAVLYHGFESNGHDRIMPVYSRPFVMPSKVIEFRDVLATIRKDPPPNPLVDYATATIRRIPMDLAHAEPAEAVLELIRSWAAQQ